MAFFLFKPILTRIFVDSSLYAIGFPHPCCTLCNILFGTFISTMSLLAKGVLRQFLAYDSIFPVTKNYYFAFFSSFFKCFSFDNITFGFICLFDCFSSFFLFFLALLYYSIFFLRLFLLFAS